jgi:hypothetical protein
MRIGSRPSVSSLKELADNIPAALPPWPCAIPIASLACVIVIDLLLQPTEPVHLVPNALRSAIRRCKTNTRLRWQVIRCR